MSTLDFLVTSKARRRLVLALWGEERRGSASQLAESLGVSFASAFRELRKLAREQLARSDRVDGVEVYSANPDHPHAEALRVLTRAPGRLRDVEADDELRARLAYLGAPLHVEHPRDEPPDLPDTVAEGARLARRDPSVARAMPVMLHARRDELVALSDDVVEAARLYGSSHALGFLCELAADLGGDRELSVLACRLKDHRVRSQDFFQIGSSRASDGSSDVGRTWGFKMRMSRDDFASTFDRFPRGRR